MESTSEWSVRTWRERHANDYFGTHPGHSTWPVYSHYPDWLDHTGKISKDSDVLEIGCGYAEWMIPLSAHVRSVTGIDIHEAPISKGRGFIAERGITNITAQVSDGTTVPFPDRSFDLVYCISVIQHIPRVIVHGYIRESARVVKPDGVVGLQFRKKSPPERNIHTAPDLDANYRNNKIPNHMLDYSVGWTREEVVAATEQAGFRIQLIEQDLFLIAILRLQ